MFWRSAGGHLWQAVYSGGWSQPVDLSTTWSSGQLLQSAPSAALAPNGQQVVFWAGAKARSRGGLDLAGAWHGPAATKAPPGEGRSSDLGTSGGRRCGRRPVRLLAGCRRTSVGSLVCGLLERARGSDQELEWPGTAGLVTDRRIRRRRFAGCLLEGGRQPSVGSVVQRFVERAGRLGRAGGHAVRPQCDEHVRRQGVPVLAEHRRRLDCVELDWRVEWPGRSVVRVAHRSAGECTVGGLDTRWLCAGVVLARHGRASLGSVVHQQMEWTRRLDETLGGCAASRLGAQRRGHAGRAHAVGLLAGRQRSPLGGLVLGLMEWAGRLDGQVGQRRSSRITTECADHPGWEAAGDLLARHRGPSLGSLVLGVVERPGRLEQPAGRAAHFSPQRRRWR